MCELNSSMLSARYWVHQGNKEEYKNRDLQEYQDVIERQTHWQELWYSSVIADTWLIFPNASGEEWGDSQGEIYKQGTYNITYIIENGDLYYYKMVASVLFDLQGFMKLVASI